jgi:uncharacterized surface protein with fasciclin (FAS1) repeats
VARVSAAREIQIEGTCVLPGEEPKPERIQKGAETKMKKAIATIAFAVLAIAGTAAVYAANDNTVMVGGQAMYPTKDIVDNAVNSADHTTLVAAVKAAGLVDTLKGPGPFTVFAPVNSAFAKLPAGTVETLLKPENHAMLVKILTYHVVAGRLSTEDLRKQIRAGHGQATLTTVSGGTLTLMMNGDDNIMIKDEKGDVANLTIANVNQSNGVIQVIDTVLLPN